MTNEERLKKIERWIDDFDKKSALANHLVIGLFIGIVVGFASAFFLFS